MMLNTSATNNNTNKPDLLMVTHRLPYPPNKGERIRSWHMLKTLAEEYNVFLACPVDEPVNLNAWRELNKLTTRLAFQPIGKYKRWINALRGAAKGQSLTQNLFHVQSLKKIINQWCCEHDFAAALAVCSSSAHYIAELDIPRKVLDLVDVDSEKWHQYAHNSHFPHRQIYNLEAKRLARYEQSLANHFDSIAVTTATEAKIYKQIAQNAEIVIVPNGVDLDYFEPRLSAQHPTVVFTGVLNYQPNVEGLKWLAHEVWPNVRETVPDAVLRIVGRDPAKSIKKLNRIQGIDVVGPVHDVREYLGNATLAVAPLKTARGVQNKVLQAMAMQKPVVATPQAVDGIGAQDGKHLFIPRTTTQWIITMISILQNPQQAQRIARSARRFVETNHQWNKCLQPMITTLSPITDDYIRKLYPPLVPAA